MVIASVVSEELKREFIALLKYVRLKYGKKLPSYVVSIPNMNF